MTQIKIIRKRKYIIFIFLLIPFLFSCQKEVSHLQQALELAGKNRSELEKVITHYSQSEADSLKLKAALFLIENMPGHYSYGGEDILKYYDEVIPILISGLPLEIQKEKIGKIAAGYPHISDKTVQDIEIITSDYLINNIDHAFILWEKTWAKHLDFNQFCEYLLPYKCFELQQPDQWKDTLYNRFSRELEAIPYNDESSETAYHVALSLIRNLKQTLNPSVNITDHSHPFHSASTCYRMPYGTYQAYNNLVVSVLRSVGIAGFTESFPQWGKDDAAHSWCSFLNDHGQVMPSQWGIFSDFSSYFFPAESIPKVFRQGYSINRQTEEYLRKSTHKHPVFSVFDHDVTDEYMITSDLSIPVFDRRPEGEYVYIALFGSTGWSVADYGIVKDKQAHFKKMGRDVLYIALKADETGLKPISHPFLLDKGGKVEFLIADTLDNKKVVLKRIYPKSYHNRNHPADGSNISPGETYELKYWNSKVWCSLGKKTSGKDYLEFDHVPSNSLLWLSNLSEKKKERVFIYRDDKQHWQ